MKSKGSAHLIRSVFLEDHVDTGRELAADGAHDYAVGLPGLDLPLVVVLEVGVEAAGRGVSIRFKLPRSTNLKFPTQR